MLYPPDVFLERDNVASPVLARVATQKRARGVASGLRGCMGARNQFEEVLKPSSNCLVE